jgi:hypothetical protein
MTVRFLLRYMSRPLHFFGGFGMLGIMGGSVMAVILMGLKVLNPSMDVMHHHGPMFVIGSVLIVSGIQMLAIGLLGELQVRHYYTTSQHPTSYSVDRLVRLVSADEQSMLSESKEDNF